MKLVVLSSVFCMSVLLGCAAVTRKSCPDIPGWRFVGDSNHSKLAYISLQSASHLNVHMRVLSAQHIAEKLEEIKKMPMSQIEKNQNDMTLRTCCDYKNKCKFELYEFNRGKPEWELCTFEAGCNGVMDQSLKITSKYGDGGSQTTTYCRNVIEEGFNVPMSICKSKQAFSAVNLPMYPINF